MTYTRLRVTAIAFVTLTTAAHAQAPRRSSTALKAEDATSTASDRTRGFMLGVHSLGATAVKIAGGEVEGSFSTTFGAGAGVTVGYGITRLLSAFATLDLAKQKTAPDNYPEGSWGLSHFEVGARANLPLGGSSTVPYVTGSMGRRALAATTNTEDGDRVDVTFSGRMFAVGGGIEHFFSPTMALDAGVGVGFGKFNNFKVADEEYDPGTTSTTSMRLHLGVTWRPGARRSS
jgi:hypothetical protein